MAKKKKKKNDKPFNPDVDTGIVRPVTVRVATRDANDKFSEYPSSGLTPRKLARIFRDADEGNVRAQMELFEEIEEKDPHLFSQMQTRKLAVTGLDWEIQPFSEEEIDKEIAEFVVEQLKGIDNFKNVLMDMLDAIGKGISIMELCWGVDENGANVIEDIEYVHPKKLIWDSITDEMKICTEAYSYGIPLPENKFVIHTYKARSGHVSRAGIMRVIAWMYLFKNYDLKDWVSFCEVFGMPLRLGKYNASASEEDKKQLMEAIYSIGTDAAGTIPDTTIIEFIESQKTTSVEIYERLARYCDEQMSKAVLGQTLSSDTGGGSFAQGKVHNEVRHDLTVADAEALAETIRRDIIRPLVEYNYGINADIPLFSFDCKEVEDQKETVEILKTLACEMGLKIPVSFIRKKFNVPKPENGEEVLEPQHYERAVSGERPDAMEEKALKESAGRIEQRQIDTIVAMSNKQAENIFSEMLKPIIGIIDESETMEELQAVLKDDKTLMKLYKDMDSTGLEDLLHQGDYLSRLIGRTME